jgi:hypothetical protein
MGRTEAGDLLMTRLPSIGGAKAVGYRQCCGLGAHRGKESSLRHSNRGPGHRGAHRLRGCHQPGMLIGIIPES